MTSQGWLKGAAIAIACLLGSTASASAQITTGTIAGTVTDAQGGVIPGANVVLVSESQSTKSQPVVTSSTGDFTFVNVKADTYTIEVTMPSFRTLRRAGVPVSPGQRVAVGTLVIQVGGATEVVDVKGETPVIQASSGERSFTVDTDSVQNLPILGRAFTQLAALAPGVTGTTRIGDRSSTGGGNTNVQMDGVSTMDTRQQPAPSSIPTSSRSPSQGPVSSYQGRVRPLERPADHRRDQERHESLPRSSTTSSATPTGTRTARPTSSTAIRRRS